MLLSIDVWNKRSSTTQCPPVLFWSSSVGTDRVWGSEPPTHRWTAAGRGGAAAPARQNCTQVGVKGSLHIRYKYTQYDTTNCTYSISAFHFLLVLCLNFCSKVYMFVIWLHSFSLYLLHHNWTCVTLPAHRHLSHLQQSEGVDYHCQGFKSQLHHTQTQQ